MANPTTNYSFAMPQNSDLVKDLPADFEVFGQAVDTQMKTNADLVIPKTIVDAKGDLIAATAADTVSRLAVGTNDQVLVADSSTATGLKWATPATPSAGANWSLLNGPVGTPISGASTITISGISNKDKIMLWFKYATTSSAGSEIFVRFNGDTGSNYSFAGQLNQWGASYSSANCGGVESTNGTSYKVTATSGSTSSSAFGYVILTGGNSSGTKIIQSVGASNSAGASNHQSLSTAGTWNNSATVTSVSINTNSGSFTTGGTIYVYTSN